MIYLGIDQTGAIDSGGYPKPLPACLLINNQLKPIYLSRLSRQAILEVVSHEDFLRLRICIDCVLGLPREIPVSWRNAILSTLEVPGYGRTPARIYFRKLLKSAKTKQLPRRNIETLCQANSVFLEHPFQKNIQTGTFRFWKDMAQDPNWFYIPRLPAEKKRAKLSKLKDSQIPICEGYPSLAWRVLFKVKKRLPEQFPKLLRENSPNIRVTPADLKLLRADPNLADAAVLSLLAKREMTKELTSPASQEGWILGADL